MSITLLDTRPSAETYTTTPNSIPSQQVVDHWVPGFFAALSLAATRRGAELLRDPERLSYYAQLRDLPRQGLGAAAVAMQQEAISAVGNTTLEGRRMQFVHGGFLNGNPEMGVQGFATLPSAVQDLIGSLALWPDKREPVFSNPCAPVVVARSSESWDSFSVELVAAGDYRFGRDKLLHTYSPIERGEGFEALAGRWGQDLASPEAEKIIDPPLGMATEAPKIHKQPGRHAERWLEPPIDRLKDLQSEVGEFLAWCAKTPELKRAVPKTQDPLAITLDRFLQ